MINKSALFFGMLFYQVYFFASGSIYPINKIIRNDKNIHFEDTDDFKKTCEAAVSKSTTEDLIFNLQTLNIYRGKLEAKKLDLIQAEKRISLPSVLINCEEAFCGGLDGEHFINSLANNPNEAGMIMTYLLYLLRQEPEKTIEEAFKYSSEDVVTLADIIRLQSIITSPPGGRSKNTIDKKLWARAHESNNVCNKLIAWSTFHKTEQSPAELLALYRECLIGGCSYLENVALYAIKRQKDYREEVAKLLEEYIASNPPADDGTLPIMRNDFPNLIEGAKQIIAITRNIDKAPKSNDIEAGLSSKITPNLSSPKLNANEQKTITQPTREPLASIPLGIWAVVILAAFGIAWLIFKRYKLGS